MEMLTRDIQNYCYNPQFLGNFVCSYPERGEAKRLGVCDEGKFLGKPADLTGSTQEL